MAPAKFGDLGKEAKDLINKNFHFGVIKFEGKTKTKNGVVSFICSISPFLYKMYKQYKSSEKEVSGSKANKF